MKNNLIGVSGRIGAGKDTIGEIIQYLNESHFTSENGYSFEEYLEETKLESKPNNKYQIRKYASKTTEAYENITGVNYHSLSREEKELERPKYVEFAEECKVIFGKDVWINALFVDYKEQKDRTCLTCYHSFNFNEVDNSPHYVCPRCGGSNDAAILIEPSNWLVTDVRFPDEVKAIEDRGGVVIRVNRPDEPLIEDGTTIYYPPFDDVEHPSETALDDYEFDYVINNNGTIEDLVEKVKQLDL